MSIVSLLAVYFVIWWLCLFLVLPFGIRSHLEEGEEVIKGNEPGAPWRANIGRKIFITTIFSSIVMALLFWGLSNPLIQEYWR